MVSIVPPADKVGSTVRRKSSKRIKKKSRGVIVVAWDMIFQIQNNWKKDKKPYCKNRELWLLDTLSI